MLLLQPKHPSLPLSQPLLWSCQPSYLLDLGHTGFLLFLSRYANTVSPQCICSQCSLSLKCFCPHTYLISTRLLSFKLKTISSERPSLISNLNKILYSDPHMGPEHFHTYHSHTIMHVIFTSWPPSQLHEGEGLTRAL